MEPQADDNLAKKVGWEKNTVAMITTLLPETHYSRFLCAAMQKNAPLRLAIYADDNPGNSFIRDCSFVLKVWCKGFRYVWDVARQARRDLPIMVHLQHEINMYGGALSAILFPLLLAVLRLSGTVTVTTIHSVVEKRLIDNDFSGYFLRKKTFLRPVLLRIFFSCLYRLIGLLSHQVIVHTEMMKGVLEKDYHVLRCKIVVLRHGVPIFFDQRASEKKEDKPRYFFCFGYIARRKGIGELLKGFAEFSRKKQFAGNFRLVFAGGAIARQEFAKKEVEEAVAALGIQELVEFRGFVEAGELAELFSEACAVVLPAAISIAASGPLSLAWGHGKCAAVSNVGNFREEVIDKVDGLLVENDAWGEAFFWMANNPEMMTKIENKVKEKAKERNWEKIAKQHWKLYGDIIDSMKNK